MCETTNTCRCFGGPWFVHRPSLSNDELREKSNSSDCVGSLQTMSTFLKLNMFQTSHICRRMELYHWFREIKVTSGDITLEATCQSFLSFRVFQVTHETLSRFVPCSACCRCTSRAEKCSGFGLSLHCLSHRPVVPGVGGMRSKVVHFWSLYCSYTVNTSLTISNRILHRYAVPISVQYIHRS